MEGEVINVPCTSIQQKNTNNDDICLPYKPLYSSLIMAPREWPEQEHEQCENIYGNIKHSYKNPTAYIINMSMQSKEKEWNCVISQLYQWSRD